MNWEAAEFVTGAQSRPSAGCLEEESTRTTRAKPSRNKLQAQKDVTKSARENRRATKVQRFSSATGTHLVRMIKENEDVGRKRRQAEND